MFAKREPATAPSRIIPVLAAHQGSVAWMKPAAVQNGRTHHRAEHQPTRKPQPQQGERGNHASAHQNCEFQDRVATRLGRARYRIHGQPEERQAGGQAQYDQQYPHDLHDRDAAHVGPELGG